MTNPDGRVRRTLIIALVLVVSGLAGCGEHATVEVSAASIRGGADLFRVNDCATCHSIDEEPEAGPTLRGLYGTTVELEDGTEVVVDDAYLVESILRPEAKRASGYDDIEMPSYEGLVTAEDARMLAEYIKSLE